jgi:hypothetical protein
MLRSILFISSTVLENKQALFGKTWEQGYLPNETRRGGINAGLKKILPE